MPSPKGSSLFPQQRHILIAFKEKRGFTQAPGEPLLGWFLRGPFSVQVPFTVVCTVQGDPAIPSSEEEKNWRKKSFHFYESPWPSWARSDRGVKPCNGPLSLWTLHLWPLSQHCRPEMKSVPWGKLHVLGLFWVASLSVLEHQRHLSTSNAISFKIKTPVFCT